MGFISFFSCLMNNVIENENYYRFMRAWLDVGHLVIKKNDINKLAQKIQTEHEMDIYSKCWTIVKSKAFNQTSNYVCWNKTLIFNIYFDEMRCNNENCLYDTTKDFIHVNANTNTKERIKLFEECIYELAKTSNKVDIIDPYAIASEKNRKALKKVASIIRDINDKSIIVLYTRDRKNEQRIPKDQVKILCNNITNVTQINIVNNNFDIHDRYILFNNRAVRMSRGVLDVINAGYVASWNYKGLGHPYGNMRELDNNIAYKI